MIAAMELDESQQLQELQVLLSQSKDYASAGDPANAIAVSVFRCKTMRDIDTFFRLQAR